MSAWLLVALTGCYKPLVPKCSTETPCEAGKECKEGQCVCKAGFVSCATTCAQLQTDPDNCGACGKTCPPTETCQAGKCTGTNKPPPQCKPTEARCGTACVTLFNNPLHCGACDKACPAGDACSNGVCGCPKTHVRCSGACVNLQNTSAHCGSCGNACPAGQSCCQGTCGNTGGPKPEECDGKDNDCDGSIDEELSKPCYSGPSGTEGKGICKGGTQLCTKGQWSPCTGEVTPKPPGCDGKDSDCDGQIDPPCNVDPWHQTAGTTQDDYGLDITTDKQGNVYVKGFTNSVIQANKTTFAPKGDNRHFVLKYDPTGTPLWIIPAGRTTSDHNKGQVSILDNGDLLISGTFNGTISWGNKSIKSLGGNGAFLARVKPDGELRWATEIDGTGNEWGNGHTVDASGNIYVTGSFRTTFTIANNTLTPKGSWDVFLVKIDKDGKAIWAKAIGSPGNDTAHRVQVDPTKKQAVYIAGTFDNALECGKHKVSSLGYKDVYLARLDQQGECMWLKSVGGSSTEEFGGLTVHTTGLTIAGIFHGTAAFGAQRLQTLDKHSDTFVARYDDKGNMRWAKAIASPSTTQLHSITTSKSGKTYLFGTYHDTLTVDKQSIKTPTSPAAYIVALGGAGAPTWLQHIHRPANVGGGIIPNTIAVDSQDNVTVGGTFVGTHSFGGVKQKSRARYDLFLSHLSPRGTTLWVLAVGLDSTEKFSALHIDSRDLIYMTGGYYSSPTIDGKKLPERGNMDMITIKRKPR